MLRRLLQPVFKVVAYTAAGVLILLAVIVGLFRLFLPRLPEYQEEIKLWASDAIGMRVEFEAMDARWGLRGPQLRFYGAELIRPDTGTRALAADEVGVGVSLARLLVDRTLVVDTVTISDTRIELRQADDSRWWVQGTPASELVRGHSAAPGLASVTVIADDVEVAVVRPGDERPEFFDVTRVVVARDAGRTSIDADIRPPESIGRSLTVSAIQLAPAGGSSAPWDLAVETRALDLAGLSAMLPEELPRFGGGSGELALDLVVDGGAVTSASATIDLASVALGDGAAFDLSGRLEISNGTEDWLVAADELRIVSATSDWPETSLRLEVGTGPGGELVRLDASASYLNLDDVSLIEYWLSDDHRALVDELRPDGLVRDLSVTVTNPGADDLDFSASAVLEGVGAAAWGRFPGIRNFSGSLRADRDGGLLDVDSDYMLLSLPNYLSEPIDIDAARGTVIWRRSDDHMTILSDSIEIRNSTIDSQSNIEITIDGGNAPVVDFASQWSIDDISAARRLIPGKIMHPRLYEWFQTALVAGRVPEGTTRLYGSLDRFPFDDGGGRFLIEAAIRDMTFRYLRNFPEARLSEMQVVLDNMRLYTTSNRSVSSGNSTIDAKVEIADLREPVLVIDAFSTGTLESLQDFAAESPIADVFGGQLDRVSVSGDASMQLDLSVPLKNWREFDFSARILSDGGTLTIDGLPAAVTELTGAVTVGRDSVASEALTGRFLGEPVTFEVANAGDDEPAYRVVATAAGIATARGLTDDLGVPLSGQLGGATAYEVAIRFPNTGAETLAPLSVRVTSDLAGLTVDLPEPFTKPAEEALELDGRIDFVPGEQRILSLGRLGDVSTWELAFAPDDAGWDFDRGSLELGGGATTMPETRGLHIAGITGELRLNDWLALGRDRDERLGLADRIRSIDLAIGSLYAFGQRYEDHSVEVDRGGLDWIVRIAGPLAEGSLLVPYDLAADRPIALDMERLILPGDDTADQSEPPDVDPRTLPAISLAAKDFAIGNRHFGDTVAEFEKTSEGIYASNLVATDPTFRIVGSAGWVATAADPSGSQSFLTATLESTDVRETMRRLDYQPGIVSDDLGILLDIAWSGGPRLDFLDTLDGEVQVRLGSGQLVEVEPGAGRVFGLMSIVALPRRLSLDFRDVFEKGFGFDEITGTFSISDGVATTCNLGLEGPAADIAIIGSVDLSERQYAQAAVVSTNVSNALPVVGAVVAGPQAAAALLIFTQIFKKPLREVGQLYYDVSGSWDEPDIDSASADAFTERAGQSGCIDQSE